MKSILTLTLFVCVLLLFASCNKADDKYSVENNKTSLSSTIENVSSSDDISSISSKDNNLNELSSKNDDISSNEPTEENKPAHTHSYTSVIAKNATCTTDGEKIFSCECGSTYTEKIIAFGHKWGGWTVLLKPSTSYDGISIRYCNGCNKVENQIIPKLPQEKPKAISQEQLSVICEKFLQYVNEERVKLGLHSLVKNDYLNSVATIRSSEIIELFSHTRPNGASCFTVIDNSVYPYVTAGENIIMTTHLGDGTGDYMGEWTGSDSDLELVAFWMFKLFKESEGHYQNMISSDYKECGYGISYVIDEESNTPLFYGAHLFGAR